LSVVVDVVQCTCDVPNPRAFVAAPLLVPVRKLTLQQTQ
jgi:hypothetical protein